jgi:hypothetical protein
MREKVESRDCSKNKLEEGVSVRSQVFVIVY